MNGQTFYRGGTSLTPRLRDVVFNRKTGLLQPTRGISVYSRPDGLDRFGGAFQVTKVPPELQIVQIGKDPFHHEIVPIAPMTFQEYEDALARVVLVTN